MVTRLPSITELSSLIEYQNGSIALPSVFNVNHEEYWSSTVDLNNQNNAYTVRFSGTSVKNVLNDAPTNGANAYRKCVRGGK